MVKKNKGEVVIKELYKSDSYCFIQFLCSARAKNTGRADGLHDNFSSGV